MSRGRLNVNWSIMLVNREEREFKPEPCAQTEEGEEAVENLWLADTS